MSRVNLRPHCGVPRAIRAAAALLLALAATYGAAGDARAADRAADRAAAGEPRGETAREPAGAVGDAIPGEPGEGLMRLRELYLAAVSDRSAIDRGLAEVVSLRATPAARASVRLDATLSSYEGALVTLRAKHAVWPPRKLQHLRDGLAVLDSVVAAHPGHAEARYLRLMSCYYLPSILGRSDSVREDFAALAGTLPSVRAEYPPELYRAIVRFVLENGSPDPQARAALQQSLASAGGTTPATSE
jgi:hypothetical protein